jgi:hypothetical protein
MCRYLRTRCITEGVSEWLAGRWVRRSSGVDKHSCRGADHLGRGYLVDASTEMDLDHTRNGIAHRMRGMLKELSMEKDEKQISEADNLAKEKA